MTLHSACRILGDRVVPNYLRAEGHRVPLQGVLHGGSAVQLVLAVVLAIVAIAFSWDAVESICEALTIQLPTRRRMTVNAIPNSPVNKWLTFRQLDRLQLQDLNSFLFLSLSIELPITLVC